jgi:hypothetical protein
MLNTSQPSNLLADQANQTLVSCIGFPQFYICFYLCKLLVKRCNDQQVYALAVGLSCANCEKR